MARLSNGFLGNASGKIGNVVFSRWRRIETARQYQPDIQDAQSPAQIRQRSRMVALLQFLKPLNKTFIHLYNAPLAVGSTPWAVAIKANMQNVSPEGFLPLEKLILGDPRFPAPELTDVIFNPFLNQTSFAFNPCNNPAVPTPFPLVATSVLGKYISDSANHEFDTRHILCSFPDGKFFCSIYGDQFNNVFDNWWAGGLFWLMNFNTYFNARFNDINSGLSNPVYFQTVPTLDGFSTDITENQVPNEAITWQYILTGSNWSLIFTIDFSKTTLTNPSDHTLIFWAVSFLDTLHEQTGPYEWDLANATFEIPLGSAGFKGSAIMLFSIFKKTGERISCFNRLYIDKGSDNVTYPYFEQLFNCNYSYPSSFILPENQSGFCGSIDELFGEFIELYEQGIIHNDADIPSTAEYTLPSMNSTLGTVNVTNYTHADASSFYFAPNTLAILTPTPAVGNVFSNWTGIDAADVVSIGGGAYELLMSKTRALTAVFIPA